MAVPRLPTAVLGCKGLQTILDSPTTIQHTPKPASKQCIMKKICGVIQLVDKCRDFKIRNNLDPPDVVYWTLMSNIPLIYGTIYQSFMCLCDCSN